MLTTDVTVCEIQISYVTLHIKHEDKKKWLFFLTKGHKESLTLIKEKRCILKLAFIITWICLILLNIDGLNLN